MSIGRSLSVNLPGVWPIRKARKVVEAFQDEARERGFRIVMLEVTTSVDSFPKVLLQLHCLTHDVPVAPCSVCEVCLQESR